jgi:hypothetical protein
MSASDADRRAKPIGGEGDDALAGNDERSESWEADRPLSIDLEAALPELKERR